MRKFHEFDCPTCGGAGERKRRVDLKRQCPWSIILTMECPIGHRWTTYEKDESRCTEYDFFEDDETA